MNRWRLALPEREWFGLVYARVPVVNLCCNAFRTTRALPPLPLQHLGQRLATEVPPILVRELAYGEVRFLLAGTRSAEGHAKNLHLRAAGARTLRLSAHLARSQLRHRLRQEDPSYETF
jgi:hypothetical protein